MPPIRDLVVQLVLDLFRIHRLPWDGAGNPKTDHLIQKLQRAFDPISSEEELEQLLVTNTVSREAKRWTVVYLRPPVRERGLVPLLAGKFDFTGRWPELRLQLGLFSLGTADEVVSSAFRFETPESPDRAGRHDFYHVQPIGEFAGQSLQAHPPSTETPATPLDAGDPIALVLCLIVSLYGSTGISDLSQDMRNLISVQINELRVIRHRPQYFRVTQGGRTIICCSRSENAHARVSEQYQAAQIAECTAGEYENAAERERVFVA